MIDREIACKVKALAGSSKRKVLAFIEFLENGQDSSKTTEFTLTFSWEGCLADSAKTVTSVDLQHESLEWRN